MLIFLVKQNIKTTYIYIIDNNMSWADAIGKKLIKEIRIEIPTVFIYHIQKICVKCDKMFIYKHSDDTEKLERQLCWN